MKYLTAGESHGKGLVGILEGLPAGLRLDAAYTANECARRMSGYGRGGRMRIETDTVEFWSGVRGGMTLGSPVALVIPNRDYENWEAVMGAFEADTSKRTLTALRPGHADYAGCRKYGFTDARNVLERASARQTAMRVAIGSLCKQFLNELGITIGSHVSMLGGIRSNVRAESAVGLNERADASPVRCLDAAAEKKMIERIDYCRENGDTAGGEIVVIASGLPAGYGSHVEYYRKLDYLLCGQLASLQAVKSVGIGLGASAGNRLGSETQDEMFPEGGGVSRPTNHAGGIEGGISNGEDIVVACTVKPIPTLMRGLRTVDLVSGLPVRSAPERSDVCAVPAAGVVAENIAAYVLAEVILLTLGGDTMEEVRGRFEAKKQ